MNRLSAVVGVLGTLGLVGSADAALYAARGAGQAGELYILNPATGATLTDIGPTNDSVGGNYGITGMAFKPGTGLLYASAANTSAGPGSLLTIDPATARVTVVGSFGLPSGNTMTDLAFDPTTGTLYGISSTGGANLYTINIATGAATQVGPAGPTFTTGGGVEVSAAGVIYGTPTRTQFGTYNRTTGAYTDINAAMTQPVGTGQGYDAIAFDGAGLLYGINISTPATGRATHLVTIDTATGTVTDIGASVTALDAMTFGPLPEPSVAGMAMGMSGLAMMRRGRRRT